MGKVRVDIQALRGIAILLVLLYHADIGPFQAGYLGVDIFFVISGFLVTGMVKRAIEERRFRFGDFYYHRAKRLLPAAYITFLFTALGAPVFLDAAALVDFRIQLWSAVTFTANITPWVVADAMQVSPELQPLVHTWSLSVEEQYYLLLPACLVFFKPKYWLPGTAAILGISFVTFVIVLPIDLVLSYIFLPTRAWQLAIGSLLALSMWDSRIYPTWVGTTGFYLGGALLLIVPLFSFASTHMAIDALLVSLGTAAVIWSKQSLLQNNVAFKLLAKIGNISYSLYLLHVPLIVFLNNLTDAKPTFESRLLVVAIALLASYFLFRYIEEPIHRKEFSPAMKRQFIGLLILASVLLLALPLAYKTS